MWRTNKKGQHYKISGSSVKGVKSSAFPEGMTSSRFKRGSDSEGFYTISEIDPEIGSFVDADELEDFAREKADYYETNERSKFYKDQPKKYVSVKPHPDGEGKWTISYGQALINWPKFDTKEDAEKAAMMYLDE